MAAHWVPMLGGGARWEYRRVRPTHEPLLYLGSIMRVGRDVYWGHVTVTLVPTRPGAHRRDRVMGWTFGWVDSYAVAAECVVQGLHDGHVERRSIARAPSPRAPSPRAPRAKPQRAEPWRLLTPSSGGCPGCPLSFLGGCTVGHCPRATRAPLLSGAKKIDGARQKTRPSPHRKKSPKPRG